MTGFINRQNSMGMQYTLTREGEGKTKIHCLTVKKTIIVDHPLEDLNKGWYLWMNGAFIQRAFPFLNADEREFLMTGITSEEWDKLFPEDDDDETKGDNNGPTN